MRKPTRAEYVAGCRVLLGVDYLWGGKTPRDGLDCSGLVTHVLYALGGPDLRFSHNTDTIWNMWPETFSPRPGDVALYGGSRPDDVSHVEVIVSVDHGIVQMIGASGGDSTTTSREAARALKRPARVQEKSTHLYRKDFRGFRQNPHLAD